MTDPRTSASPDPEQSGGAVSSGGGPVSAHLDLDALADALVGELDDDAHLRGCADCTARLRELEAAEGDVRAALAGLPAPELPDALASRWQDALRRTADHDDLPSSTVVPLRRPRRAWPASVAASLVLVLAGAWGWTVLGDVGRGDSESASTAAGGGSADRSEDTAGATSDAADELSVAAAPVPRSATGLDYADPVSRSAAVAQLLADGTAGTEPRTEAALPLSTARADGLDRLRDPEALAACLAAVGAAPLAVDDARFGDEPALSVLQATPDPDVLLLTVVGAGCSSDDPEVLLTTSVPRPG